MSWEPYILNATNITFGDFLASQPEGERINNDAGYVLFGETTLGDYAGVNGSG